MIVAQAQLFSQHGYLIIAVHQLASMDLPKVFQLQALKLQDLHPLNELEKCPQVLVKHSSR